MPVYLPLASIIIRKTSVFEKYSGGVAAFRREYFDLQGDDKQEDDDLFLVDGMNHDEFDHDILIKNGLHYDNALERSEDFVIHQRYHGLLWPADWLEDNTIYAWHVDTTEDLKAKAKAFEIISMHEIGELFDLGLEPFAPITLANHHDHPITVWLNAQDRISEKVMKDDI